MIRLALSAIALAALPPVALAQTVAFADLTEIDRAVERMTGAPIGAPGGARTPVDRRMKLAQCRAPLMVGWHGSGRDTVRVECPDPRSWKIYVSLAGGAPQTQATEMIARGDRVSVTVEGRGFSVAQSGEALEGGSLGDWIRVKPPGKAEAVRAKVAQPGRVTIPLS